MSQAKAGLTNELIKSIAHFFTKSKHFTVVEKTAAKKNPIMNGNSKFLTKRHDLVFQKPFYEK